MIALVFGLVLLVRPCATTARVMSSSLEFSDAAETPSSSSTRQLIDPNPGVHLLSTLQKQKEEEEYKKMMKHCSLMSTTSTSTLLLLNSLRGGYWYLVFLGLGWVGCRARFLIILIQPTSLASDLFQRNHHSKLD